MRKFCLIMSGIFAVLAIILYFDSIKDVDGFGKVANVQETVFCAACAILFAINLVGSFILSSHEDLESTIIRAQKELEAKIGTGSIPQKNTVSSAIDIESTKPSAPIHTVQKSENPEWINDGDNFVKCPQCGNRMSIDFIKARKKCPNCGCVYKS